MEPKDDLRMKFTPKPPLGVTPYAIWREARAMDLARAIKEYLEFESYPRKYETLIEWSEELTGHLNYLSMKQKEKEAP